MATSKRLVDPITGYIYTGTESGLVEVQDPKSDGCGLFEESGRAVSGELTYANRQLIGWVARAVRSGAATEKEETNHG
jgi:hypothetical protein